MQVSREEEELSSDEQALGASVPFGSSDQHFMCLKKGRAKRPHCMSLVALSVSDNSFPFKDSSDVLKTC